MFRYVSLDSYTSYLSIQCMESKFSLSYIHASIEILSEIVRGVHLFVVKVKFYSADIICIVFK